MASINTDYVVSFGMKTNQNNGNYRHGVAYDIQKKIEIVDKYEELLAKSREHGTKLPSARTVAKEVHVSKTAVSKVLKEHKNGGLIDPRDNPQYRYIGPGSKTLDEVDEVVLLSLRENPQRSLRSYRVGLLEKTGTEVSETTIHRFWKHGFQIQANLLKPDLVPIDKYKPENVERAWEYMAYISKVEPHRL